MCILAFLPSGVQPEERKLEICVENNPDGNGFAIAHNGRLITRRGMGAGLVSLFCKLRRQFPDGPAMWHSRIATAGVVAKTNCHPFKVGNDPKTVVGHNGILPRVFQPGKGDQRSDTAILAMHDLPRRNFDGLKSMRRLGRLIGTDKLVILTVNQRWRENAYIVGEEYGHWVDDTWYSNHGYSPYSYTGSRFVISGRYGYGGSLTQCLTEGCRTRCYYRHCIDCLRKRGKGKLTWRPCAEPSCMGHTPEEFCVWHGPNAGTGSDLAEVGDYQWPSEPVLVTRSPTPCTTCTSPNAVSTVTAVCTVCNTCNDCNEPSTHCLCYTPAQLDRDPATLDGLHGDGHTLG